MYAAALRTAAIRGTWWARWTARAALNVQPVPWSPVVWIAGCASATGSSPGTPTQSVQVPLAAPPVSTIAGPYAASSRDHHARWRIGSEQGTCLVGVGSDHGGNREQLIDIGSSNQLVTEDSAAGRDQHRVDDDGHAQDGKPLSEQRDNLGRAEHAGLHGGNRQVVDHGLELGGDDLERHRVDRADAEGVLRCDRGDDAGSVDVEVGERGEVGRNAGRAAGVRAGHGEDDVGRARPHRSTSPRIRRTVSAGEAARITLPMTATPWAPAARAQAALPASMPPSARTGMVVACVGVAVDRRSVARLARTRRERRQRRVGGTLGGSAAHFLGGVARAPEPPGPGRSWSARNVQPGRTRLRHPGGDHAPGPGSQRVRPTAAAATLHRGRAHAPPRASDRPRHTRARC